MNLNILFIFIFMSVAFSVNAQNEELDTFYKSEFKGVFFRSCLKVGYNKSPEINNLLLQDPSFVSDFKLGVNNYRYIDQLALKLNEKMEQDSIKSHKRWSSESGEYDFYIAKKVISTCLNYYQSEELDSIADERIKLIPTIKK